MAQRIRWSPRAADSLEEICDYIARDSEYYAALFAKKVMAMVEKIAVLPRAGRVVPEYQDKNLREVIFQNYRIVYRVRDDSVEIAVITHGARQLLID